MSGTDDYFLHPTNMPQLWIRALDWFFTGNQTLFIRIVGLKICDSILLIFYSKTVQLSICRNTHELRGLGYKEILMEHDQSIDNRQQRNKIPIEFDSAIITMGVKFL